MTDPSHHTAGWRQMFALHLALCVALFAWLALQLRPVALAEAPGEQIRCVSYGPFHAPGESPLDPAARVSPERIRADLAALSALTRCVRIYAVGQGLDAIPGIAEEFGMSVLLGAWIGTDPQLNRRELAHAIEVANRHPGTVRALLVGNEVLLRRELAPQALKALIEEARASARVPVSYADVWEFWLRNRELADAVDFVTVHILPFWEDQPVGIDHAVEHVASIRARVASAFARPVLIGETGWPSAGRRRQEAEPGRVNQARFARELLLRANREGWDYNLIEAVDQPWKRALEGTVGGHWGILDSSLGPKFALSGAIAERSGWGAVPGFAAGGAALLAALAALGARRQGWRIAAFATLGLWAGAVGALAAEHAHEAWRNAREWAVLGGVGALGALWLATAATGLAGNRGGLLRGLALGRLALLFCAALAAIWLAVDPRYRDFPVWMYAGVAPVLVLSRRLLACGRGERICAIAIGLAGLARWLMEPANPQAVGWLVLCAALALAGWPPRQHQQCQ